MLGGAPISHCLLSKGEKEDKMLQRLYVNSVYFSEVYKSVEGAYGLILQLITGKKYTRVTRSSSQ